MDLTARQLRLPADCGRHPLRVPTPPAQRGTDRVRTALRVCAVASDTSNRRRAKSGAGSSSTEVAAASSSSLSSTDDPAVSSVDATIDQTSQTAASSLSILGSFDDAYNNISDRVHDAEHAVEDAWKESVLGKGWQKYTDALATNPIRTKALTSFVGFVVGDIAAQKIGGGIGIDPFRCVRLGMYGLAIDGPFGHLWYKLLDRKVEPKNPNGLKAVLLKTAADQLIWAPIMTCVFFAVLKSLEGHPELILSTIQDKLVKTIVANYILWPGAHFINFRFVPSEHRILYNNCVSVAWNCYLSTLSHDAVLDTTQLLDVVDQAQGLLDGWLPPDLADNLSKAGLEGLRFDIPRSVELKPTRTLLDWAANVVKEQGPMP